MKWNKKIQHKPYHGQTKTIKKFAFLPITCENGECVWLERVKILQEYRINPTGNWVNVKFV